MTTTGGQRLCILYLSCLGDGLQYLLPFAEDFTARYHVVPYISHNMDTIAENVIIAEEHLANCDLFIHHNPEWVPSFNEQHLDAYDRVLARVNPGAQKIAFPLAQFHPFWPFHTNDPRNADPGRPLNRFEEIPDYPYGDAFVVEMMQQSMPPEEIITRYLDLDFASRVDLDHMLQWSLSYMQRNEANCDIKIVDYVASTFRTQKLFSSVNHINNRLLHYAANQILQAVGCKPLPQILLEQLHNLVGFEMPVHPSIGRHFGVEYVDEDARYVIDRTRHSTFAEYIRNYVYFD